MDSAIRLKIVSKRSMKRRLQRTMERNQSEQCQNLQDHDTTVSISNSNEMSNEVPIPLNDDDFDDNFDDNFGDDFDDDFEDYVWSESENEDTNEDEGNTIEQRELSWSEEIQILAVKHNLTQSVVSDFLKLLIKKGVKEVNFF